MKAVEDRKLGGSAGARNIVLCGILQKELDDLAGESTKGHLCFPSDSETSDNEN